MTQIPVLTSVRNNTRFLQRWLAYYAPLFGEENLYVMLDGQDQDIPEGYQNVNFLRLPHVQKSRLAGDKHRAARASSLAKLLLSSYKLVIGTDIDEFLAVDPAVSNSLPDYLLSLNIKSNCSALGLDVAQHATHEHTLEWNMPFLTQRRFAKLSDRYTKALILSKPIRWGSGQHRVKGHGFHIDPHLYLFHFGSVDKEETQVRERDNERVSHGWQAHQNRRNALFDDITNGAALDGDKRFETARKELSRSRSLIAWNKPRPLTKNDIIEIPKRFRQLM